MFALSGATRSYATASLEPWGFGVFLGGRNHCLRTRKPAQSNEGNTKNPAIRKKNYDIVIGAT